MPGDAPSSAHGTKVVPLTVKLAVVAGSNLAGAGSLLFVWWLRAKGLLGDTPLWFLFALILSSLPLDLASRRWLEGNRASRLRVELRVVTSVAITASVIYAAGWGAILSIAFALCVVQLLAQTPEADWRTAYGWCVLAVLAGELAVALNVAPSIVENQISHAVAAVGLAALAPVLWVVSGAFAERDAVERATREREERLAREVGTDPLTQLGNRSLLLEVLEQRDEHRGRALLAFVDLNDFKDVNDTFGHNVGDAVLIEVGNRLRNLVRSNDFVARVGGDEFVVLVNDPDPALDSTNLAARIQDALGGAWDTIAPHVLNASVGVVEDPDGRLPAHEMLRRADEAMYARKHGTSATGSLQVMTSRALAHHRTAMNGLQGTFCVLRAIRNDDEITDWRVIEANNLLRTQYGTVGKDPLGRPCSELPSCPEAREVMAACEMATSERRRSEFELELRRLDGGAFWANVVVVPIERDVVAVMIRDITADKRARDDLETERLRAGALLSDANGLACIVDERGTFLYHPPWSQTFLGHAPGTLPAPLDLVVEGDRPQALAWFDNVVSSGSGGDSKTTTLRMRAVDGSVRTCAVTAKNRANEPAVGGIVLNINDVSAVVEAEARLAAVTENVDDIIGIVDASGCLAWVSAAAERALGFTPSDIVGRSAFDLVHAEDRERAMHRLAEVLGGDDTESAPIEMRVYDVHGRYRWFECSGTNRLADPALKGVVISLHDVTDRRAAEEALRISEQRSTAIVEAVADAIVTVDGAGDIRGFNRAAETIFGIRRSEALARPYTRFLPAESMEMLRELLRSGRLGEEVDTLATRATGETFDARVSLSRFELAGTEMFTAVIRDITDQLAMEAALRRAALRDELTGLPNRRTLLDRLSEAISRRDAQDGTVGLMFIDVDHFKLVNDSLGHDVGDEVLIELGNRIGSQLRHTDMIARMSGDDFVVLCVGVDSVRTMTAIADRIAETLRAPIAVRDGEIFVTASIGVALWRNSDSPLDVLRHAETAMYRAKRRGRSQLETFDAEMHEEVVTRLAFESALRRAVDEDELEAYYQPIVDLDTHAVAYFEALVRWNRPGTGIVSPNAFIPAAEAAGLIVGIGEWMLRRATRDCASWQEIAPGVGVSVNVSVQQFGAGDLVRSVREALAESALDAELLTLEITESVMLADTERNAAIMSELRALGVHIALDDFGTGYSSLTYLRRLPIDSLKIDRSFLQSLETDARDAAMLQAIVDLGATYNVTVVAEGIDSETKLRSVRAVGCQLGQGYLFSAPVRLDEVAMHLAVDRAIS